MTLDAWVPLLVLCSSLVPGLLIFGLEESRVRLRTTLNLAGALTKLALVGVMLWGVAHGHTYEVRVTFLPGLDLALRAGPLALLFLVLSSLLWLVTTIYAIGYLEGSPHRSRFFGFFSLCVTATVGVAMAADMLTFLLFYEMLTLATYPLVVHRGTEVARRAGQVYLAYTIGGGALMLLGIVWLYTLTGTLEFTPRGFVSELDPSHHSALILIFVFLITGLGVKAALIPLHAWLPMAMVAPAPVSALLHAVAVVKAGAFGIVRVVYEVFGVEFAALLGVMMPLAILAAATILYGSLRAVFQDDLKRRLAFSTVSQVSYIVLGVAIASPIATVGGLVHLVHQGLMKITLFFCAGNLAETLGIHKISEMNGVGRRMPWTMVAFTVAAFGMIGAPPVAGFITKWYLGLGALDAGQHWVLLVLAGSSLLNAVYFLPILHAAWFREPPATWPEEREFGRREIAPALLWPPLVTAVAALLAGLFAALPFSPLEWARFIAEQEFSRP
ncbi:complex I subunit 5 family protein [Thiocapsa bogorovii]|uniref:complex I subunit 5 family protein n=1 Tax=Thiocapsa bogorovii TaxID=521689 RepID=UPI001E528749|nr:proton-conducting transporter membrane subunit [Thiocapsa bogorovii]UHD14383.1 monovalent cation/H+ antiporter subunit D family protein [Thiocapsa bogorovii]